jgi:hypothetical protein
MTLGAYLNTFEENTNKTGVSFLTVSNSNHSNHHYKCNYFQLFLHIKNISCPYNDALMEDVVCSLTSEDQKLGRLYFAATLKTTIHLMWVSSIPN